MNAKNKYKAIQTNKIVLHIPPLICKLVFIAVDAVKIRQNSSLEAGYGSFFLNG